MSIYKNLAHRLFSISSNRAAAAAATCPFSSARRLPAEEPPLPLRMLQRRPFFQSAVPPDWLSALPTGENPIEKICGLGGGRIILDRIRPQVEGLTAAQMEAVRAKLRSVPGSCVSYSEFVQFCCEVSSEDQGTGIARSLVESGAVIMLGDAVLLRPDQLQRKDGKIATED